MERPDENWPGKLAPGKDAPPNLYLVKMSFILIVDTPFFPFSETLLLKKYTFTALFVL